MSTSSSEYLRRRMQSMPQIISPRKLGDASLLIQVRRYQASACSILRNRTDGTSVVPTSEARLATIGGGAVCGSPPQVTSTTACCPYVSGSAALPTAYQGFSRCPCLGSPLTAQKAGPVCCSSGPGYTNTYLANDFKAGNYSLPLCSS